MTSIDSLGRLASDVAMRAFVDYARRQRKTFDLDVAIATLRRVCRERVHEALADAREALDCGMGAAAEATFVSSMRLAGIDAAKEVLHERAA